MRYYLSLAVLVCVVMGMSGPAFAEMGLKLGANLANWSGASVSTQGKVGFQLGGFVKQDLSDKFSMRYELLYSQKGANYSSSVTDGSNTYAVSYADNFDYVELPVLFQYQAMPMLSLYAGPYVSYLLTAKTHIAISGASVDVDQLPNVNALDYGAIAGLGVTLGNWVVDLRYELGLADVNKTGSSIRSNNMALSAGYRF
ncbi:MAG: porin family protein [Candidatus Margulisiibacteriota bacterium]